MTRRPAARWTPLLLLALALGPTRAAAGDVDEANRRWRGATCHLRLSVVLGKGTDAEGRSHSPWYTVPEDDLAFRVHVSDRAAIAHLLRDKTLPAWETFVCDGWRMVDPDRSHGGLWLDLRFRDLPVTMQVELWLKHPGERFAVAERYMRVTAFQLEAADERLVDVPVAPVATSPHTAAGRLPPTPSAPAPTAAPALRLRAVAAQPPRVPPGGELAMVLTYEVGGVPAGASFEVLEVREVFRGEQRLAGFEERLARAAGAFTSSQPLRLPPDLAPGLYSLRARVATAGREASGSALFEVVGVP